MKGDISSAAQLNDKAEQHQTSHHHLRDNQLEMPDIQNMMDIAETATTDLRIIRIPPQP